MIMPDLKDLAAEYLENAKQMESRIQQLESQLKHTRRLESQRKLLLLGSDLFDQSADMLRRGVLIRHLILPQQGENTRRVIDWVGQTFAPGQVLFSLMSQYTPVGDLARWPELQHPISPELNEEMYQYLIGSPITDGFYQDLDAATGDMIPAFDGTGV